MPIHSDWRLSEYNLIKNKDRIYLNWT